MTGKQYLFGTYTDKAGSNRTKCNKCRKKILIGSDRFVHEEMVGRYAKREYWHIKCILPKIEDMAKKIFIDLV